MSVKAMRQGIEALVHTDTHPLSSAEQYHKEIEAMEALEDAIEDAQEREWVGLTIDEIIQIDRELDARSYSIFDYTRAIEAKLKEKNHVS